MELVFIIFLTQIATGFVGIAMIAILHLINTTKLYYETVKVVKEIWYSRL